MYLDGRTRGNPIRVVTPDATWTMYAKTRGNAYADRMRIQRLPKESPWDRKYAGSHRRWVRHLLMERGLENQKDFWQAFREKRTFRSKPPIQ